MKISTNFKKAAAILAPVAVGGLFLAAVATTSGTSANVTGITNLVTYFKDLLASDFIRVVCLIMLVVAMVTMIMGKGLQAGMLGLVGVGFLGLIAPSLIDTFTTTLPTAEQISALASSVVLK